jgi:hypothetical protein
MPRNECLSERQMNCFLKSIDKVSFAGWPETLPQSKPRHWLSAIVDVSNTLSEGRKMISGEVSHRHGWIIIRFALKCVISIGFLTNQSCLTKTIVQSNSICGLIRNMVITITNTVRNRRRQLRLLRIHLWRVGGGITWFSFCECWFWVAHWAQDSILFYSIHVGAPDGIVNGLLFLDEIETIIIAISHPLGFLLALRWSLAIVLINCNRSWWHLWLHSTLKSLFSCNFSIGHANPSAA